jgi:2-polyprenyl-3-methyl-5-hydroxy-6-metoxy-1,4-benzoquinol methylase
MSVESMFQPSHTPFSISKYESSYEVGRTRLIEELIPNSSGGAAVDIGCGPGYFCRVLKSKGWKTTAIDTDRENLETAIEYAEETHLGDAISTLARLHEERYDLAIALEIIEHMPRSHGEQLLQSIRRVLKSGGALIISTPNKLSPEGVGGYYWGEQIRKEGKWDAWDPTHVYVYSSVEMIRVLKSNGFVVERIIGYYYEGRLPIIGRWRLPIDMSARFPLNRLGFNVMFYCRKG